MSDDFRDISTDVAFPVYRGATAMVFSKLIELFKNDVEKITPKMLADKLPLKHSVVQAKMLELENDGVVINTGRRVDDSPVYKENEDLRIINRLDYDTL